MRTISGDEELLVSMMLMAFLRDNRKRVEEVVADEERDRHTLFANGFGAGVLMALEELKAGRLSYHSEAEVGGWEKN